MYTTAIPYGYDLNALYHGCLVVSQWDHEKSLIKSQHGFTAQVKAEVNAQYSSRVSHHKRPQKFFGYATFFRLLPYSHSMSYVMQ